MRFLKARAPFLIVTLLAILILLISLFYLRHELERSMVARTEKTLNDRLQWVSVQLREKYGEFRKKMEYCRGSGFRLLPLPVKDTFLFCAKRPDWLLPGTRYPDDYRLPEISRRFGNNFSGYEIPMGLAGYLERFGDTPDKQRRFIRRYLADNAKEKRPGRLFSGGLLRLLSVRDPGCFRHQVFSEMGKRSIPLLICQRDPTADPSAREDTESGSAANRNHSSTRIVTVHSLEPLRSVNDLLYQWVWLPVGLLLFLIAIALPFLLAGREGVPSGAKRISPFMSPESMEDFFQIDNQMRGNVGSYGPNISVEFSEPELSASSADLGQRSLSAIQHLGDRNGRFIAFWGLDVSDESSVAKATAVIADICSWLRTSALAATESVSSDFATGVGFPESWLENAFIHLEAKKKERGEEHCLTFTSGVLDLQSGVLYSMSGGNLPPVVLRAGDAFYIENGERISLSNGPQSSSREEAGRRIRICRLLPADVIVIASGLWSLEEELDRTVEGDRNGKLRRLFPVLVAESEARPNKMIRELRRRFGNRTELALLRIGYREQEQKLLPEKELPHEYREIIERYFTTSNSDSSGEVEKELEKINPDFRDHPDVRRTRIKILLDHQDYSQCRNALEGFLEDRPWETELLFALAVCYRKTGRPERALQIARIVLLREPDLLKGILLQGEIYRELGEVVAVRGILERMRAIDPHYEGIKRLIDSA